MTEIVHASRAALDAAVETMRNQSARIAELEASLADSNQANGQLEAKVAELRALLSRSQTSLSENVNNPVSDGREATP